MVGFGSRPCEATGGEVEFAQDRMHYPQRRREGAARWAMLAAWISVSAALGPLDRGHAGEARPVKIKMATEHERSITATLGDNPAARDLAALLPLTLTLKDYAST